MIDRFIGVPFTHQGRSFKGADCYGLVILYYKEILGINIIDTTIKANQPRRVYANFLKEITQNWEECKKQKNSVVALCMHVEHPQMVTHFGVMIDDDTMLHTLDKQNSHLVNIDDAKVAPFLKGFYKWQH